MADEVTGTNSAEVWVNIDPSADYDATVASIENVAGGYAGLSHSVVTYPQDRIQQILHKPGRDLTVRVYGNDLSVLASQAGEVSKLLGTVRGVANPKVDLAPNEPAFVVKVDLTAAERAGIKPGDVRRAAATLLSGLVVGSLFEEQKVFDVVVRGAPQTRGDLSGIGELLIDTPAGGHVRLKDVASVTVAATPNVIQHQGVSRFVDVGADVKGRGIGGVAGEVKARLQSVKFPFEYHAEVLGDYAQGDAAQRRFIAVCIAAAIGILMLLQAALASWRLAAMVAAVLPAALAGGLVAVWADGGTVSLGSVVGFFAVFAIATRNCLLLIRCYQRLSRETSDKSTFDIAVWGTLQRLAPIATTAVGGVLVLLTFVVFGHRAGYEIAHPLAIVVIGGLVTSTLVSLLVVPALYGRFAPRKDLVEAAFAVPPAITTDENDQAGTEVKAMVLSAPTSPKESG
jgi:Cu/Ag efflux pump CusA